MSDTIIARAPLPGCQGGQDLVLDEQQRVAYVDCADNATLLMLDLASMKVLSTQSVGNNPDLMTLDNGWHYLYVASESGVVSVFDVHERTIKEVNEGFVDPGGAHTIAVDQQTHYIYLPLENVGGMPVLRIALFQHSTDLIHQPNFDRYVYSTFLLIEARCLVCYNIRVQRSDLFVISTLSYTRSKFIRKSACVHC